MEREKTICNCNHITLGDIEAVIKDGATSFEEVQSRIDVSNCCGDCKEYAHSIANEILGETIE